MKICPIYVVAGKDIYQRTEAINKLHDELLGKDEGIGEVRLEGKNLDIKVALDELRTLPFLSQRKVVIIDDADKFISENRATLEKYLEDPCPTGVMILIADSWRKSTNLDKQIKKIGKIYTADEMKGEFLTNWLIARATQVGKQLTKSSAIRLVDIVGTDTGKLANEIEKLSIFVGQRKQIAIEDIESLSGQSAERDVFMMTNLMADGRTDEVLKILNQILDADRSAEFSMAGVLTFTLRKLLKGKIMLESGMSPNEVIFACKVFYNKDNFIAQLKRFTTQRLKNLIAQLAKIDYDNKTGLGKPRMNLEKFILCASNS